MNSLVLYLVILVAYIVRFMMPRVSIVRLSLKLSEENEERRDEDDEMMFLFFVLASLLLFA